MLISSMSFLLKFQFQFILGERVEHQVMVTHSHDFDFSIPICEEVKKIYMDHSHHPKIPSYHIVILIYITQHWVRGLLEKCVWLLYSMIYVTNVPKM